ncbi:MAG: DJ-1/PfpI family protein [Pseudomonadota bacterium]
MPSNTDKRKSCPLIVFVVYPGVKLLDLSGPLQVFQDARSEDGTEIYRTAIASVDGGMIETDTPIAVSTVPVARLRRQAIDTVIVVGGGGARAAAMDRALLNAVKELAGHARRVGSVCTGAFVLSSAGVLDGRRAVTHWESCEMLARHADSVRVETDPIFIKDGNVWTSAGVTAGIDMALAMVEEDQGRQTALELARSLVAYLVRPGGQSQFSAFLDRQIADHGGRFDRLHQWIRDNLGQDLRVEHLAGQVNMSPRNFARVYTAETGRTPAKAVEMMRTEAARRQLEEADVSIASVAQACGFGDDERMRRSFMRLLNVAPQDYRKRFRQTRPD